MEKKIILAFVLFLLLETNLVKVLRYINSNKSSNNWNRKLVIENNEEKTILYEIKTNEKYLQYLLEYVSGNEDEDDFQCFIEYQCIETIKNLFDEVGVNKEMVIIYEDQKYDLSSKEDFLFCLYSSMQSYKSIKNEDGVEEQTIGFIDDD